MKQRWTADTFAVYPDVQCNKCEKWFEKDEAVFSNNGSENFCCDCVASFMSEKMESMEKASTTIRDIIGSNIEDGNLISMAQSQINMCWKVIDILEIDFRDKTTEGNKTS